MPIATLFVGNLPYATSERELREVFEQAGVAVTGLRIVTDMDSGRSRGHAFVEVAGPEAADKAKAALHGWRLEGRKLVVDDAHLRRGGRRRGRNVETAGSRKARP